MRALRPDRVLGLPSGLWVLDELQPVAAVLDPATGRVLARVSWREVPPARSIEAWPPPQVFSDGAALWTQQEASGPLVRVGLQGVTTAAWTAGLLLAACGPDAAWCAPAPPDQELVAGPDPHPVRDLHGDQLLRVGADGGCRAVRTERPVRAVRASAEGLLVQVDVDGWTLQHLGGDLHEVVRSSRWLRLPWDAAVPAQLTEAVHGLAADVVPGDRTDGGRHGPFWEHSGPEAAGPAGDEPDVDEQPLVALGLVWRFGWAHGRTGVDRRALATAHRLDGQEVGRWDLGAGTVRTVAVVGEHVCVVLAPDRAPVAGSSPSGRVLLLAPAAAEATVLMADDSVDISDLCWPLPPRPLEVDSYLAQTLAEHSTLGSRWHGVSDAAGEAHPLTDGMSDVRTALVGEWPHTQLEWTFAYAACPGLVLRRRVPLFDELGRPDPPQYAGIHLMEDLETRDLPPTSRARDGVLDV